jgi:hypothetical protein
VETNRDKLKKTFPNLAREMDWNPQKVSIQSVRTDVEAAEKKISRTSLIHFDPDVVDFLRRCDNNQQAEEIIDFLEKRGEITDTYARKLRQQLRKNGLRSFGPKKEAGYYLQAAKP